MFKQNKSIKYIIFYFTIALLYSCGKKYELKINNKKIDITTYIDSGKYIPKYCDNDLIGMISFDSTITKRKINDHIVSSINAWCNEVNNCLKQNYADSLYVNLEKTPPKMDYYFSTFNNDNILTHIYIITINTKINILEKVKLKIEFNEQGDIIRDAETKGWDILFCEKAQDNLQTINDSVFNNCLY